MVFTPKGKANGLGIVDVVSGAYYSDRRKLRDHILAQLYSIFCSRGYTVFCDSTRLPHPLHGGGNGGQRQNGYSLRQAARLGIQD